MSASAGSGKTYTLAYEYVRNTISVPSRFSHILAVTFTNKATEEMKRRILHSVNELACGRDAGGYRMKLACDLGLDDETITARAKDARTGILHDYSRFSVLTIDKFFQRVIRAFLKELGINANYALELNSESLLGNATDRLLGETSTDERLRSYIMSITNERIDDNKAWSVKDEIKNLGRQLFTEAYKNATGSLKGTEEFNAAAQQLMRSATKAKTGIVAAAEKLLVFMNSHGLEPDDFPYKKSGVGGYIVKMASGILEPYGSRVIEALEGKWTSTKSPKKNIIERLEPQLTALLRALCAEYDDSSVIINTAALVRENKSKFMLLNDLRRKIEEISREEDILHITEVNDIISKLVSGNDAPFIFEKAGNHFTHFMIDEFQDTSAMQWNNFIPLLKNSVAQSEDETVLLVGDVKQSIYRWRGGDWSILAGKAAMEFSESGFGSLQDNYRSRAELVRFMNAVIGRCVAEDSRVIDSTLKEGVLKKRLSEVEKDTLSSVLSIAYSDYEQTIPEGKEGGCATVTYYGSDADGKYVPPVIEMIEDMQKRGYQARDIAILVRRNTEGSLMAQTLLEYKNDNPGSAYCYDVITQDALIIGKSPVVNFIIACMKLAIRTDDPLSGAQYNLWMKHEPVRAISPEEENFFAWLRLRSPEEAFEHIIIRYSLDRRENEISYLQALHQQIITFSAKKIADIPVFVKWWEETGSGESVSLPSDVNAITIDTIHRSKGLGYKAVIIPYCNWGMTPKVSSIIWAEANGGSPASGLGKFPVAYKKDMAVSDFSGGFYSEYVMSHIDNLNLFYVAVTRAKEELHIMIPAKAMREKQETIDRLITASLDTEGDSVAMGGVQGNVSRPGSNTVYSFGALPVQTERPSTGSIFNTGFPTYDISGRIRLKLSRQRYFDEGLTDLAPRDYGILMHKAFENAVTADDIRENILLMGKDGIITADESSKLYSNIENAMEEETVGGWFAGEWDEVRNESNIIVPGAGGYRPDRVMIKGSEAVVVDYKFGLNEKKQYDSQLGGYLSLLSGMGYGPVSGYIWYINLGKVVKAEF